jgi:hypothetical protein
MKPETVFLPDAASDPFSAEARLSDLRVECVTFDAAGLPKRRRLVTLLSMLEPPRRRATRRKTLDGEI